MQIEEHFDEEFSEIMRYINEPNEEINVQKRELLKITEKGYEEEREIYAKNWIVVSSVKQFWQVVDKAE